MINLKQLKDIDPLLRNAEKALDEAEFSPMDPPDAYSPPGAGEVDYDSMHPFIQQLMDEHDAIVNHLDSFEKVLIAISEEGFSRDLHQQLSDFFRAFDEVIVVHNYKEEKFLFQPLQKRLLEEGDHSQSSERRTAVDLLEDDHIKVLQLAAVTFNFFGLASRLPDPPSAAVALDAAVEQGKVLVDVLRLHIFRENNVVFPKAQECLSTQAKDDLLAKLG